MAGELQQQLDRNWRVKIIPTVGMRNNGLSGMLFQSAKMLMNAMWPAVDKRILAIVNFAENAI